MHAVGRPLGRSLLTDQPHRCIHNPVDIDRQHGAGVAFAILPGGADAGRWLDRGVLRTVRAVAGSGHWAEESNAGRADSDSKMKRTGVTGEKHPRTPGNFREFLQRGWGCQHRFACGG